MKQLGAGGRRPQAKQPKGCGPPLDDGELLWQDSFDGRGQAPPPWKDGASCANKEDATWTLRSVGMGIKTSCLKEGDSCVFVGLNRVVWSACFQKGGHATTLWAIATQGGGAGGDGFAPLPGGCTMGQNLHPMTNTKTEFSLFYSPPPFTCVGWNR